MNRSIYRNALSHIARHFNSARIDRDQRIVDVVREAGYKNINKGCRRLKGIENGERQPDDSIYERFADILDIDLSVIEEEQRKLVIRTRESWHRNKPPLILGTLLKQARQKLGLSILDLPDLPDFTLPKNFTYRLLRFEEGRARFPTQSELDLLSRILQIPRRDLDTAYHKECDTYDRMGNKPELTIRSIPGFAFPVELPWPSNTAICIDFAVDYSTSKGLTVWLNFPGDRRIQIRPNGIRTERVPIDQL